MVCNYCGSKVKDDANYCPNCGEKPNTTKKNKLKEDNSEVVVVDSLLKKEKVDDSSDLFVLWGILGFFAPIVGLILFLVWKDEKPKDAKASGIGALIRAGLILFTLIIVFIMFFFTALYNV